MKRRITVCVSISLTYVLDPEDRKWILKMLRFLEHNFFIEILPFDFDFERWEPMNQDNVFESSTKRVESADLFIIFFPSSRGSDGRGGEALLRKLSGKTMLAFASIDVKISPYMTGLLKDAGVKVHRVGSYIGMEPHIRASIQKIYTNDDRQSSV